MFHRLPPRALGAALLFFIAASVFAVERVGIDHAYVAALAQKLAARAYAPAEKGVPKFFRKINYDTYRRITFRADTSLWRDSGLPYQLQFFHPGYLFSGVRLNEFTDTHTQPIPFAQTFFDYHDVEVPLLSRWGLEFAGFRVLHPLNKPDKWDEIISFLGASYFRALGRDHVYGASARGIAIGAGGREKEEFPDFTEFWIRKPEPGAASLTVHALLDGPSVAGAYTFIITPGAVTTIEARATLFFRREVTSAGFAPLSSMFWFGEGSANRFGNFRPEVHDSDGLLVATDAGTRIWRPLLNPPALLRTDFEATAPAGFGLLQRDRSFASYSDLEAHYERRPGIWTELTGEWPSGVIRLVEMPAENEYHDNVTAFWAPKHALPTGKPVELTWKQHWSNAATFGGPPGWVAATRQTVRDGAPDRTRYVIDFNPASLASVPADANVTAVVSASDGAVITHQVLRNAAEKTWRIVLQVQAKSGNRPVDIRAQLSHDGHPVSEIWTTRWSP